MRDALAAEYVLGTLCGPARRRFERWLAGDAELRGRVARWEFRLAGQLLDTQPVEPPLAVWRRLRGRLGAGSGSRARRSRLAPLAVAAMLLLAMGVWLFAPSGQVGHKVVISEPPDETLWVVKAEGERLRVRTLRNPGMGPQQECRLWLYWEDEDRYESVAVLAEEPGRYRLSLPEGAGNLADSRVLVSVTPAGRQAGQRPAGEVIFRGGWARL